MPDNQIELLLLDATQQLECANPNKWNAASEDSVKTFINSIETSMGTGLEKEEKYRSMISGVPSPWARVTITRKALTIKPQNKDSVLAHCYRTFKEEWRGLMAAYVLRSDSFELSDPIALVGPTVEQNNGEMSVLETYGEMLFKDVPLWTLKREKVDRKNNPPCIQILYYKDARNERIPVGATSPFTFFFTSVNYNLTSAEKEISWLQDGKFIDPTSSKGKQYITDEERRRLHAFLVNIASMIHKREVETADSSKYYTDWMKEVIEANPAYRINSAAVVSSIRDFQQALIGWAGELEASLEAVNTNVPINTVKPQGPLSILLNSEKEFYLGGTNLYVDPGQGREMIKSTEIFNDSEFIAAWRQGADPDKDFKNSCAYYLPVLNDNLYLALPFTAKALSVFKLAISQIMGGQDNIRLSARTVTESQVEIKMYARLDGQGAEIPVCQKTYRIEPISEMEGKVFTWPNFYSDEWKNYYYYSEFPSNGSGKRMIPVYEGGPSFLTEEDREKNKDFYLVTYPLKVDASLPKYEIIRTPVRVNAVQVWLDKAGTPVPAGTLLMREDRYTKPGSSPHDAVVGIDFGSTNTCAYYKLPGGTPQPIPFSNRRMAIVGFDNKPKAMAQKDELLFISNEEPLNNNGQVKSWLHDHNLYYLTETGRLDKVTRLNQEIVGGIPVNESNITVRSMDRYTIQTNAGTLYHNMKWLGEDIIKQRKTSFIRMLWLQICADLFADNMVPAQLNWSFPSAMTPTGRADLKTIFTSATASCPFTIPYKVIKQEIDPKEAHIKDYTEAEADCAFAIQKRDNVDPNSLVLGIDVGGSTSDILILGMDVKSKLFTQSSVRIASGFFFDAIKSSSKFRNSLRNFHDSKVVEGLSVMDIQSIVSDVPEQYDRAPYFLNNVFDQLKTEEDFRLFYNTMNTDVRPIFALPAYVTGMLVFYCGMLVRNAIETNELEIKRVTLRHYGKGGRLFEWITDIYGLMGQNYYRQCFRAGVGEKLSQTLLPLEFGITEKSESKSEVAIGLVSDIKDISSGELDENMNRIIQPFEIVGEEGVEYVEGKNRTPISAKQIIPDELFKGGIHAMFSPEMTNFSRFLDIFLQFVVDNTGILKNKDELKRQKGTINVTTFILNDPEYEKARADGTSYRQPVIIVEALDYLNRVLLPMVAKEIDR